MTVLAAIANLLIGAAFVTVGVMTAQELMRGWRTLGYSHFGVAFLALAMTCGPHHLAHGVHLAFEGRSAGGLDLITSAVGLPTGVLWLALRFEAQMGGRGDRFVVGTPWWLAILPPAFAAYATMIGSAVVNRMRDGDVPLWILPNLLLVPIYVGIGVYLLRTQISNRKIDGGWSASGLLLAGVFWSCSLMHLVWAAYVMSGRYTFDSHGFAIDWLSVPAGLYFLFVVQRLHRDAVRDWNRAPQQIGVPSRV
jgi:hypothetical protein